MPVAVPARDAEPFTTARLGPAATSLFDLPPDRTPIASLTPRHRTRVAGRVRAIRVQPWTGTPALECILADDTGSITLVFLGRREIAGVRPGTIMAVTGVAGQHHGMRAILNPEYELISVPAAPTDPGRH